MALFAITIIIFWTRWLALLEMAEAFLLVMACAMFWGSVNRNRTQASADQMGALIYIVVLCGKRVRERRLTLLMLARTSSNGTEIESKVGLLIAIQLERKYLRDWVGNESEGHFPGWLSITF